jgi:two-component system, sensor histidine kinase and response regulator
MSANRQQARLLIVDDEAAQLRALCSTLELEGYKTLGFSSPQRALTELRPGEIDLLLTDLMMPEMDGISLINAAREIDSTLGAIVMTGHGTIDTAVQAMQGGALDYILKPFKLSVILPIITRALDVQRLRRENAELQLREQRRSEELAAAYQVLESFSYSVAHDLRSPLLAIDGFAQMLEEDFAVQLGEKGREVTRVIHDGCLKMDQLIVGLLAFSRASGQSLTLLPMNMTALAKEAENEVKAGYVCPDTLIEIAELPPCSGDATVIRQVWANLIGNAVKYSAKRPCPCVKISGRTDGDENIYQVEDNGAGFDMRYAHKLFGVFQRLHGKEDFAGTGVGLAIAQRIIVRHGGRIWAQSAPDEGARFQFALPVRPNS